MNIITEDFLIDKFLNDIVVISLVDASKMDVVFFGLIEYWTHENAYELIEQRHIEIFKCRRYKNFESYRIAKHRRQRDK
jgi:hypothetical protein